MSDQGVPCVRRWASRPGVQATAIAAVTVILLLCTAQQGFVRDEGYYFRAAKDYHGYFENIPQQVSEHGLASLVAKETIDRHFSFNPEHPGLVKLLMGLTWQIGHRTLGWLSQATALRLASMLLVGVGMAFLYLFGLRLFDRSVALLAVVLLLCCPHVFYHAHLACFDGPIMGMTVFSTYAFWRALHCRRWLIGAGLAWGIAIATKHNAVFLLPTFVLAYGLAHARRLFICLRRRNWPRLPGVFVSLIVCGPLVFLLLYPYGWPAPVERVWGYYRFHLHHEHYPVDYFGSLLTSPPFPWHFPWVMSAITVPLPILAMASLGVVALCLRLWRVPAAILGEQAEAAPEPSADVHTGVPPPPAATADRWREAGYLLLLGILVPPMIISIPSVPIFGGTKHWMTMMPFFCLLGAWTTLMASRQLAGFCRRRWPGLQRLAPALLLALVIGLPAAETARTHPVQHTYFNEILFGHQGAAILGMPRTFWGGDARSLLDTLNEQAKRGARVFTDRMNWDDFRAYQLDGMLRPDLSYTIDVDQADWAFINHQREYQANEMLVWRRTETTKPVATVEFDGVPIVSLYRMNE